MDSYAAKKIATRKFIEHKGQEFLRQNTKNMSSYTETAGDLFKITWTMSDVDSDEILKTKDEKTEVQSVTIAVDMDSGDVEVVEDTIKSIVSD